MRSIEYIAVVAFAWLIIGCAQTPPKQPLSEGIHQHIEVRDGRRSVWGVDIVVKDYRFKQNIEADQVEIKLLSHGRVINHRVLWSVSEDGSRLNIVLKPGEADFRRGSTVAIRVARAALTGYDKPDGPLWRMPTTLIDPGITDMMWGPGVKDPDILHRRLEAIVYYADDRRGVYLTDIDSGRAFGMVSTMTWEQAARVYGKASRNLKRLMCFALISGQERRFEGMTREQVISLLGEPEEQGPSEDDSGGAWAMSYNGYGYVSDGTGALILLFDKDGEFLRIGYPG